MSEDARVIGEPRHHKGYSQLLTCQALNGQPTLSEFILQKRDAPELLKTLVKKPDRVPVLRLTTAGNKIIAGEFR